MKSLNRAVSFATVLIAFATVVSGADVKTAFDVQRPLPSAPGDLTARAGDRRVVLNWGDAKRASSYRVYMGTSPGGERLIADGVDESRYVKKGLTNGVKYYFKVAAVNRGGVGPFSNVVSATPKGKDAPAAPKNLAANAGDKKIVLKWTASEGATSYNLYRGTSAGGEAPFKMGITGTTYADAGLTNGTKYFYMVAAVNGGGTSAKSNEASGTPNGPVGPPAPKNLIATAGDKKIVLKWTASEGATSYNLYRGTSAGGEAPYKMGINGTTYTDTGLTNGTKYFYMVAAVNGGGTSAKSNEASGTPNGPVGPPAPKNLIATAGDKKIVLTWTTSEGATSYNLYRGTAAGGQGSTPFKMGLTGTTYTDTGVTNGTKYFYMLAAVNGDGTSAKSNEASATPTGPVGPPAPKSLAASAGDKKVVLTWIASEGATSYNLYRGTAAGAEAPIPVQTGLTGTTYTDTGLTNGTKYFYQLAAVNADGTSAKSNEASATPVGPPAPAAPKNLAANSGDARIILTWTASTGATSYNLYRGTAAGAEAVDPVQVGIAGTTFTDTGLTNGVRYFYTVAAVNAAAAVSAKSNEASALPSGPTLTAQQRDAFRFLRQSTFGPTMLLVDHVVSVGKGAFLDEQFALPPSQYPDALITTPNMELVSEQFFQNAIQGPDQLRQRVAWALSQVYVVSAVKVDNTHAMVPYIRMLEQNAFGNVKDILKNVTLSPAMGEFLDMVNNKKATSTAMPNENYARELLQLLSIGLTKMNSDGTPMLFNGAPEVTFSQADIADLSRVLTGWTYGDNRTTNPNNLNPPYYDGPMKPVERFHDNLQKTVLGQTFVAGQTAQQDLDQALTLIFNHQNVGPFLVRQLIQKLVQSNPSPAYIGDVVAVFNDNGNGVRGDLKAVVRAILLHAEAVNGTPTSGKFAEPALFLTNISRALGASIVDHPFLTDFSQSLSQRIWFAPSVFNYYSPNYRAGALFAPEMQIWTAATAMTRTNFAASLLGGGFGSDVTIDYAPYIAVAGDTAALVEMVNARIMGGTMPAEMKQAITTALTATTNSTERVRTALYLAATSMQYQVEH